MSANTPPSPVQPRAVTTASTEMIRAQQSSILGAVYLARPRSRDKRALPSYRTQRSYNHYAETDTKPSHSQIQLPRLEAPHLSVHTGSGTFSSPVAPGNLLASSNDLRNTAKRLQNHIPPYFGCSYNESPLTSLCRARASHYDPSHIFTPSRTPSCPPASSNHSRIPLTLWSCHTSPIGANQTPVQSEPAHFRHIAASTEHSAVSSCYAGSPQPLLCYSAATSCDTGRSALSIDTPQLVYTLKFRQQPLAARACGFGERDRRVVDPPPILELSITDKATGAPELDSTAMLALHCTLINVDANEHESLIEKETPSSRRLMGSLVASPYQAKDEHGLAGTFFVFSDLSCRTPGIYKLQFKLLRVDPLQLQPRAKHGTVSSIESSAFSVYTAKDFPGMSASTALLTALRSQGLNVGLKKGTEERVCKRKKRKESTSSEAGDASEASEGRPLSGGNDHFRVR